MKPRRQLDFLQARFLYVAGLKLVDALSVALAWRMAWVMRFQSHWIAVPKGVPSLSTYTKLTLPLTLVFIAVFHVVGVYRNDRVMFGYRSIKKVIEGSALAALVFIALLYFANTLDYSRVYLLLFGGMVILSVLVGRLVMAVGWALLQSKLVRPRRILLLGAGDQLELYRRQIEMRRPYPFEWAGRVKDEVELEAFLKEHDVDVVVVAYPHQEAARFEPVLRFLANQLLEVKILPDYGQYSTFTYQAREECGVPLLVVNEPTSGATDRVLKRTFDLAGSALLLFVLSPFLLVLGLLVKLTSRGPMFYSQVRVGADGRVFRMHKFRSMEVNAEQNTGAVWAKPGDSRVTALGKFLRKSNFDEFPQLWNVFRGEMSLVGPRPERPIFVEQFRKEVPKYMLRHQMKSGMTGWAQVNGWRGNTSIEERVKHDLYYIGHWSHGLDLKIMALTLVRGFFHRNAY